jgi:hypothetical protein
MLRSPEWEGDEYQIEAAGHHGYENSYETFYQPELNFLYILWLI